MRFKQRATSLHPNRASASRVPQWLKNSRCRAADVVCSCVCPPILHFYDVYTMRCIVQVLHHPIPAQSQRRQTSSDPFLGPICRLEGRAFPLEASGCWLAVHAGKSNKYMSYASTIRSNSALWPGCPDAQSFSSGSIIGAVRVQCCKKQGDPALASDPWATLPEPQAYCWVIDSVVALPHPIPHAGQLRVWWVDKDVTRMVLDAILGREGRGQGGAGVPRSISAHGHASASSRQASSGEHSNYSTGARASSSSRAGRGRASGVGQAGKRGAMATQGTAYAAGSGSEAQSTSTKRRRVDDASSSARASLSAGASAGSRSSPQPVQDTADADVLLGLSAGWMQHSDQSVGGSSKRSSGSTPSPTSMSDEREGEGGRKSAVLYTGASRGGSTSGSTRSDGSDSGDASHRYIQHEAHS